MISKAAFEIGARASRNNDGGGKSQEAGENFALKLLRLWDFAETQCARKEKGKSLTPQPLEGMQELSEEELIVRARSVDGVRHEAAEHRWEEGAGTAGSCTDGVRAGVVNEAERESLCWHGGKEFQ
ncbi:DUF1639 family protein [Sesbania bispinosa]|nr:DUF1639 family protein [Sesbania bispinosa]